MKKLSDKTIEEITRLTEHYLFTKGNIEDPKYLDGEGIKPQYAPFVQLLDMVTDFGRHTPSRVPKPEHEVLKMDKCPKCGTNINH